MLPKLYEFTKTNNGYTQAFLGTLTHCTKCQVREVRNEAYILTLETTVNDSCAGLLLPQRVIAAKANPFDPPQYFEIRKIERGIKGKIKAECKHIKNLCFQICSEGDTSAEGSVPISESGTPAQIWNSLLTNYISTAVPFSFSSDISTAGSFSFGMNTAETLGNILGGKEGSFLDVWGGEYHWNNFNISLLASRGAAKDYRIRYGDNISDAKQTASCENTYSYILPYGRVSDGSRKIRIFAEPVYLNQSDARFDKVLPFDCTEMLEDYVVGEHGENYGTVRLAMTNYARNYALRSGLNRLSVNISVTLRAELDEMAQIGLCDTVRVILDDLGTEATAKITEATYDSLLERWDKLVIGDARVTVADVILNKKRYVP